MKLSYFILSIMMLDQLGVDRAPSFAQVVEKRRQAETNELE
jgi:hypothetical protein